MHFFFAVNPTPRTSVVASVLARFSGVASSADAHCRQPQVEPRGERNDAYVSEIRVSGHDGLIESQHASERYRSMNSRIAWSQERAERPWSEEFSAKVSNFGQTPASREAFTRQLNFRKCKPRPREVLEAKTVVPSESVLIDTTSDSVTHLVTRTRVTAALVLKRKPHNPDRTHTAHC